MFPQVDWRMAHDGEKAFEELGHIIFFAISI
jgi:hypothetical protein